MRGSLYQKIFVWFALNLVLMGLVLALVAGWLVFFNAEGLFSPQIFRKNINATIRLVAANLQYKPMYQWASVLTGASQEYGLDFHYELLDEGGQPQGSSIPPRVLQAANRIPKPPYSLCPDPDPDDPQHSPMALDMEAGIPPAQRVIFMRAGQPARYWFGRPIFVADDTHQLHYLLLAAVSSSITGGGQFFNVEGVVSLMLGVLGLSFLWWWPFVRRISRPLKAMTETAERIAAGDYTSLLDPAAPGHCATRLAARRDEIGRLAQAVNIMADQVMRRAHGQRRFIRHIAHELGSPLARIKLGLAVLESRLDGDAQQRIGQVSVEVEQLSSLVEDVLAYLRAGAESNPPEMKAVPLCPLLHYVAGREALGMDVHIIVDEGLEIHADADFLRRALANVLRNAVRYAGGCGPMVMEARVQGSQVVVDVCDSGPGVPEEELAHIMEPFYRGATAAAHPGGSGLGLSIVKHCVEACGGQVSCQNMQPAGFVVSMRFPMDRPKAV